MNQKTVFAGLLLCLGLVQFASSNEYRMLTSKDGRSIEARVIAFDADKKKVQIERYDTKVLWIPISAFSEDTRSYIREWYEADKILSPRSLIVSIERKNTFKKEHKESFYYEVDVRNRSGGVLENVKIEYRYFITLSSDRFDIPTPKRVISGKLKLGRLDNNQGKLLRTRYVLEFEEFPYGHDTKYYDSNTGNEYRMNQYRLGVCSVEGIWIRIHGPSLDGKPTYRDICDPERLIHSLKWDEKRARMKPNFTFADFGLPDKKVMSLDEVKKRGKASDKQEFSDWQMQVYEKLNKLDLSVKEQRVLLEGLMFLCDADYDPFGRSAASIAVRCRKIGWLDGAIKWYEIALERARLTKDGEREFNGRDFERAGLYRKALINMYACSKDAEIRNGAKAVEHALILFEYDKKDAGLLDLLARAYAANDQFDLAVKTQRTANFECKRSSNSRRKLPEFEKRLELYENGQPYLYTQSGYH